MIDNIRLTFSDKEAIDKFVKDGRRRSTIQKPSRNGKDITHIYWWHNLRIISAPQTTYLEGSLHSFYNASKGVVSHQKKHRWVNFNNYTYQDVFKTIELLEETLKYDLSKTVMSICELGFNLQIDESPKDFIDKYVLMYKLKYPCFDPKYKKDMKIKKFDLDNYYCKIYDKSLQFNLNQNILRFEIGFKSEELRESGIISVKDILSEDKIDNLYSTMMNMYENILIVDSYDGNQLMCEEERDMMTIYTNPQFWVELLMRKDYNARSRHKKIFERLINDCNLDSRKKYLRERIKETYYYLSLN